MQGPGSLQLLWFYFLASWLEDPLRSVCAGSGGGACTSPSAVCIILVNALNSVLMVKCKYCFDLENESMI